jgi:stearoyl-CoA desaturase (delta-9 desaturase)
MFNLSSYRQTQLVIWINQILFFSLLVFTFSWYYIPCILLGMYIFGFMSETSLHRFYTHRAFRTGKIREYILRFFAFITGQGPILSWVNIHRTHHAYEDTEKDPHSPFHLKWWEIYFAFLPKGKKNFVVDLLRSTGAKYLMFENKYYLYMWVVLWVLLFLISYSLFFCVVAGSAAWYIGTCSVNILAHTKGVKRFEESVGFNNKFVNLLTGVGNHNNHHRFPKNVSYSVDKEIDIYSPFINRIFEIKD